MHSNEYEHAFSQFIDGEEYETANGAIFDLVRAAFQAGWDARGAETKESSIRIFP